MLCTAQLAAQRGLGQRRAQQPALQRDERGEQRRRLMHVARRDGATPLDVGSGDDPTVRQPHQALARSWVLRAARARHAQQLHHLWLGLGLGLRLGLGLGVGLGLGLGLGSGLGLGLGLGVAQQLHQPRSAPPAHTAQAAVATTAATTSAAAAAAARRWRVA